MGTTTRHVIPKVLIVGPSPSSLDLRKGVLFSHPQYDLLKETLSELGLDLANVAFANAISEVAAKLTTAQIKAGRDHLRDICRAHPGAAVLLLGAAPYEAVIGRTGISSGRGRCIEPAATKGFEGAFFFATWHPSILEIQPNLARQFREDLRAFVALATGAEQRTGVVAYTRAEKCDLVGRGMDLVAYDIETSGLLTPSCEPLPRIWMFGVSTHGPSGYQNTITNVFEPGKAVLVGHNSRGFDDQVTGFESHDTQLMAYLIDNTRTKTGGYGLQALCQEYLGVPAWKDEVTWAWDTWDQEEPEVKERTAQYCARDTQYTLELAEVLMPRLKEQGKWALYERIYLPAASVFASIHREGVYVDPERVDIARSTLESERDSALTWLTSLEWTPKNFNPGSPQQVAKVVEARWGLVSAETTSTGLPKLDDACLEDWIEHSREKGTEGEEAVTFFESIQRYRHSRKHLSTYVGAFERGRDATGRVHPAYKLHGTDTGRSATTGFPLHQLPRDVLLRGCLGAPPGYVFGATDYSNIEQRVIAWLAQEPALLAQFRAFDAGESPWDNHTLLAAKLLTKQAGSVSKTERSLGKNIGFATQYLGTAGTIQEWLYKNFSLRVSRGQAEIYRAAWFESYPGLVRWYESVWDALHLSGGIGRTILGFTRDFGRLGPDQDRRAHLEIYRQAVNLQVQSFANHLGFAALIGLAKKSQRDSFRQADFKIVGYVHDSILWTCKEENVEYCQREVELSMTVGAWAYLRNCFPNLEDGRPSVLPLRVESTVGTHWS